MNSYLKRTAPHLQSILTSVRDLLGRVMAPLHIRTIPQYLEGSGENLEIEDTAVQCGSFSPEPPHSPRPSGSSQALNQPNYPQRHNRHLLAVAPNTHAPGRHAPAIRHRCCEIA